MRGENTIITIKQQNAVILIKKLSKLDPLLYTGDWGLHTINID